MSEVFQGLVPPGQAQSEGYRYFPEIDLAPGLCQLSKLVHGLTQGAADRYVAKAQQLQPYDDRSRMLLAKIVQAVDELQTIPS